MTKLMFAPGCALMLYKPALAEKIHAFLNDRNGSVEMLSTCCQHSPDIFEDIHVINICPGCDKRFRNDYTGITTTSLWEVMAGSTTFSFPDYKGMEMTIHDACPTREQERIHGAIRTVLERMNIKLTEPKNTRTKSICCGDSFYGMIPVENVKEQMAKRAESMPVEDVVVYCVSCIKSFHIGGKRPRYLVDLLFGEVTFPGTFDPDEWHGQLTEYISEH
jgi:Fe-S oxidoreductase